ncbi:hypothetical protein COT97_01680 [Candidatus Falkowbacteria bacterium CG10_big_fil_rev_8_21_14_0_10_39_11]|uniref:Maf-like protein n=1 Tax=Candidatus Falkowbacteria bacterium CG10_big_fil_rev_8_21_14_0_10_39_11 TaxID=1974565 RepID=A0A2H0V7N4_9BACT|nr:MAG: hypothetical protein COT97_01680 [Candidatus Falkowbacteria bacterium CG10_big_fil_rev_8_21_14_0_10_39_11]
MKIVICASLAFKNEILSTADQLRQMGFEVQTPFTVGQAVNEHIEDIKDWLANMSEAEFLDLKEDRMRLHFDKIDQADAILVLNYDKNGQVNYIGGNVLIEMGYAFSQYKIIFMLRGCPDVNYTEEIKGMKPIVIDGDLDKIKYK